MADKPEESYDSKKLKYFLSILRKKSNYNIVDITEGKLIGKVLQRVPNFDGGVISGGFVAWLLGKTTTYADIDIYYPYDKKLSTINVNTGSDTKRQKNDGGNKTIPIASKDEASNTGSFIKRQETNIESEYKRSIPIARIIEAKVGNELLQSIYVFIDYLKSINKTVALITFAKWVITSFDLNICRVAIIKDNERYYLIECIADVSFEDETTEESTMEESEKNEDRKKKYLSRIPFSTIKNDHLSIIPLELANGEPMMLVDM